MSKKPNKLKYWNKLTITAVLLVLLVMIASVALTALLFVALNALGVFRDATLIGIALAALAASVIIGLVMATIMSNVFIRPIDEIMAVMRVVSKGDFSVRVRERRRSPLSALVRNFNAMIDDLSRIEMFRQDFINTFSHEFKTPIVSIRGFARQLRDGDPTPEERREYVDIIISESDRLTDMSSNILLLSKFESQKIVTGLSSFSLDEHLRHCILLLEKEWTEKEITLTVELDEVSVTSNEEMLSHVWINLISNAIKFTPRGGSVSVCLERAFGVARVEISDTGCGMDDEVRKHIFEKFYQGDRSHSVQGNGLGLSVAHRVVELLGGSISVTSAPNAGSAFTVMLPLDRE